jgi:uncharacterized membrane protein YhaH (DUF805 family)
MDPIERGSGMYGSDSGSADAAAALAGLGAYFFCYAVFVLVVVVFFMACIWVTFKKSGRSGWLTLMYFIPLVGPFVTLGVMAFGDWPALRQSAPTSYAPVPQPYPTAPPTYSPPAPPAPPTYTPPAPPAPPAG